MNVVIYTRVSTEDQSCELQLAELRKYAAIRHWNVVGEYIDHVTGDVRKRIKQGKRLRYDDLMEDAQKGMFQAVIVWKFDRFARSVIHLVSALDKFHQLGIDFISTTQNIDTTTPMGRFFFTMIGAFAEFERALIVERVKAGLKLIQETGMNSKGEKVKLGQPEVLTDEQKESILRRYRAWEPLPAIVEAEKVPLSTIYYFIKRTLVKCKHGKYRCHRCGCSHHVSVGAGAQSARRNPSGVGQVRILRMDRGAAT